MQQHYLISKCVLFSNNFLLVALGFRKSTSEGIEIKKHTNIP